MSDVPAVGIVGLGHIGGSLALALLAARRPVVATTRSSDVRARAREAGVDVVDDIAALVERVDVVIAATALDTLREVVGVVGAAATAADRSPTITDVGSVKDPLARWAAAEGLSDPSTFVAGHPMAGTEHSGWGSAQADLFRGRTWALAVDDAVPLDRWAAVAQVALAVDAEVVPVDTEDHDDTVALVSHLPYAVAALAAAAVDRAPNPALARSLAAGSFASLTRVAAGHPTLGSEMARGNRLALARQIEAQASEMGELAKALDRGDDAYVEDVFARGRAARTALDPVLGAPVRTTLDRVGLLLLGRAGGRVVAVHGATADEVEVDHVTPVASS